MLILFMTAVQVFIKLGEGQQKWKTCVMQKKDDLMTRLSTNSVKWQQERLFDNVFQRRSYLSMT